VAAIESFDYAAANFHLGRPVVLLPVDKLLTEVVFPLMQWFGDRWQDGALVIAQAHMTSSILRNLRFHGRDDHPHRPCRKPPCSLAELFNQSLGHGHAL
jgi:hypothetical protein